MCSNVCNEVVLMIVFRSYVCNIVNAMLYAGGISMCDVCNGKPVRHGGCLPTHFTDIV